MKVVFVPQLLAALLVGCGAQIRHMDAELIKEQIGSMLQFAVGFVITPSCRGGRLKPKMGCRPSQKQNNAKKQVPSP